LLFIDIFILIKDIGVELLIDIENTITMKIINYVIGPSIRGIKAHVQRDDPEIQIENIIPCK
jgi:hypothetical protein